MQKSEIRRDYIQEKYVIIAPKRSKRPKDVKHEDDITTTDNGGGCVFCPTNIKSAGKIVLQSKKSALLKESWSVTVIKNKFSTVSLDNPKAYGTQEVVVETPNHLKEIEELPNDRLVEILDVYSKRTKVITRDKKIDYVLIFKNSGGRAGASLRHSHSQIFATQFLPPHIKDKSERAKAYFKQHGACVYCDVIKKERKSPRLIIEDKNMIAFCPWAPMHNYEAWIMPKRHLDNITELNSQERLSFAKMLKKILSKIDELDMPYNYYFHQVVRDANQHLYLKIKPRGSVWAGVEIGSGLIINPISPEASAKFYRS